MYSKFVNSKKKKKNTKPYFSKTWNFLIKWKAFRLAQFCVCVCVYLPAYMCVHIYTFVK